ncbi:MAG TPA: hypothetical protein VJS47_04665 [Rhizomicrobium sp.]|nr:hypothetical protein [Rhizomicrobium sp.]
MRARLRGHLSILENGEDGNGLFNIVGLADKVVAESRVVVLTMD